MDEKQNTVSEPTISTTESRGVLDGIFSKIEKLLRYVAVIGTSLLVVAVIAVNVDVVGRLIKHPVIGVEEFNTLLLIGVIFLGIPYAQTAKKHLTVTIISDRQPKVAGEFLNCCVLALCLAFTLVFAYKSTIRAYSAFLDREVIQGAIIFPIWPSRCLMALGLILLGVQLIVDIVRGVSAGKEGLKEKRG